MLNTSYKTNPFGNKATEFSKRMNEKMLTESPNSLTAKWREFWQYTEDEKTAAQNIDALMKLDADCKNILLKKLLFAAIEEWIVLEKQCKAEREANAEDLDLPTGLE